jgi:glyoxylase-like metal-dependent hydrolase (beta-lactamase superfamily II)
VLDVHRFVDEGLGNTSYLVEVGDGRALVVDPVRDPTPYLAAAERLGLEIAFVAETHLHADFVSGGRELAAVGAELLAPSAGGLAFDHRGLVDREEVDLGGLTLRAIATPGHTPEHLSYEVADGADTLALFTGGSLIVGSIARTDLISDDQTERLTHLAYKSIRERLGAFADHVAVFPTHGAGSFCSAPGGTERTTTIERERASNPVFTTPDEDRFVLTFLAGLGTYPPYFLRTREINRRGPGIFGDRLRLPELSRLDADDVRRLVRDGAVVIDARSFEAFAHGHIAGSLSIELRPQFASWLGWVIPDGLPLVFVLDAAQDRSDLVRQCLNIGYGCPAGELAGGIAAWDEAPSVIDLVEPGMRHGSLIDVRQHIELASGRIAGSRAIELGDIERTELPSGPLTLYCGHGERGMTAASLLERMGRTDVAVLRGGPNDWLAATGEALQM